MVRLDNLELCIMDRRRWGFYNLAKDYRNYGEFVDFIKEVYMDKTPDGAKWDEADFTEMQEMMDEL